MSLFIKTVSHYVPVHARIFKVANGLWQFWKHKAEENGNLLFLFSSLWSIHVENLSESYNVLVCYLENNVILFKL